MAGIPGLFLSRFTQADVLVLADLECSLGLDEQLDQSYHLQDIPAY